MMRTTLGICLVVGALGLLACNEEPCGPSDGCGEYYDGSGSGTWTPGSGLPGNEKGSGEGGAGGEGGGGGAGGAGGSESYDQYMDLHGLCRIDAPFHDLGCPATYPEALAQERCSAENCHGPCEGQLVVEAPCEPYLRCAYNSATGELEGVVTGTFEPTFCGGQSRRLIYGDACIFAIGTVDPRCGFAPQ